VFFPGPSDFAEIREFSHRHYHFLNAPDRVPHQMIIHEVFAATSSLVQSPLSASITAARRTPNRCPKRTSSMSRPAPPTTHNHHHEPMPLDDFEDLSFKVKSPTGPVWRALPPDLPRSRLDFPALSEHFRHSNNRYPLLLVIDASMLRAFRRSSLTVPCAICPLACSDDWQGSLCNERSVTDPGGSRMVV